MAPPFVSRKPMQSAVWSCLLVLILAACAQIEEQPPPRQPPAVQVEERNAIEAGTVVGKSADVLVYLPKPGDSWKSLAARFLGDENLGWVLEQANAMPNPVRGMLVTVPMKVPVAMGVDLDGVQQIPVLCYHRIGERAAKMVVTRAAFQAQMRALRDHGYSVIRLADLIDFLDGKSPLPMKSVVITFDDGYESTFESAYPVLLEMNFPATVFLYSNFVGLADALSWAQMAQMIKSGLVDIQAHSKSHANLAQQGSGESEVAYLTRLREEFDAPRAQIATHLNTKVPYFAYPYGDANLAVLREARAAKYAAAFTVNAGGNPFFSHRYAINRTMIFGEDDLKSFLSKLTVFEHRKGP